MNNETDAVFTALIADDEPLLLASLHKELEKAWPGLRIVAEVSNGDEALKRLRDPGVDVAFLDIQMPGLTGLEVAGELMRSWQDSAEQSLSGFPPLLVFITAYGEFAVEAFEHSAIDYVLKPVTQSRLSLTISRLQTRLQERAGSTSGIEHSALQSLVLQLAQLTGEQATQASSATSSYLTLIRASAGDTVKMIPVEQVALFEAADKYVVVHTTQGQFLIRESLRALSSQLNPAQFQKIHRSSIVNMQSVKAALRDEHGKCVLKLDGVEKQPVVSRHYAHLFKAM